MPTQTSQPSGSYFVIGITGHIGAGKTSVGQHLNQAHGFFYARYSEVLADWLAHDAHAKSTLQSVGWKVMEGGMQRELNSRLLARIPPGVNVVIDGLRHPVDHECLRSTFASHYCLLCIESKPETRWKRLVHRFSTMEEFVRADSHAVEQHIPYLRQKACRVIENEGSLADLYSSTNAVIHQVKVEINI